MSEKRSAEEVSSGVEKDERSMEDLSNEAKRFKQTCCGVADEFVCPLTLELPVEPVCAEDGRTCA